MEQKGCVSPALTAGLSKALGAGLQLLKPCCPAACKAEQLVLKRGLQLEAGLCWKGWLNNGSDFNLMQLDT